MQLEELIKKIESCIGENMQWLVRKDVNGDYFANIAPNGMMLPEMKTYPAYGPTPVHALSASLNRFEIGKGVNNEEWGKEFAARKTRRKAH